MLGVVSNARRMTIVALQMVLRRQHMKYEAVHVDLYWLRAYILRGCRAFRSESFRIHCFFHPAFRRFGQGLAFGDVGHVGRG